MTRRRFCWVLGLALMAVAPAWAQDGHPRLRQLLQERAQAQRQERPLLQRQDPPPREDLQGEGRGRMTPEERRQLRRDIGDAGRDLYRREPRETLRR